MQMFTLTLLCLTACAASVVSGQEAQPAPAPAAQAKIVWGSCPQLEPSESDKKSKADILQDCLKQFPIPAQLTEATIVEHQKTIAECALKKENWFEKDGSYKFSKAEGEIKKKKLSSEMESALLKAHVECQASAKATVTDKTKVVEQVQLYQVCMDRSITAACKIEVQTLAPKPAETPATA